MRLHFEIKDFGNHVSVAVVETDEQFERLVVTLVTKTDTEIWWRIVRSMNSVGDEETMQLLKQGIEKYFPEKRIHVYHFKSDILLF